MQYTLAERKANTERAEAVLKAALEETLNHSGRFGWNIHIDKNLVDAFMCRLIDTGIDIEELEATLAEGDPDVFDTDEDE